MTDAPFNGEDDEPVEDTVRQCEGSAHYYDIYDDGSIARICRCGAKTRKVAQ